MVRRRLRIVDSALSHTIRGVQSHGVTASEFMHIPLLVWAVLVMQTTASETRESSAFWRRMESVMSLNLWSTLLIIVMALMVAGLALHRPWMLRIAYIAACAWWVHIGLVFWDLTNTYLSPAIYLIFAASCLYRFGDASDRGDVTSEAETDG